MTTLTLVMTSSFLEPGTVARGRREKRYLSEAMSITKRYFTSLLSMRS